MRVGIDVGGTNTDAVLMHGGRVVAKTKAATTADVTAGIQQAVRTLVADSGIAPGDITAVMIGTTHFTNAFVEGKELASVAVVRLCLPATQAVPPLIDWPEAARSRLKVRTFLCHGGNEFDGRAISPLDPDELRAVAEEVRREGWESIAVSGVYSSINPADELRAAEVFAEYAPGIPVSLSHEIGRVGMLERENATVVNACLRPLAARTVDAFRAAVAGLGVEAAVYVSQNDGTLATMETTERYPVTTFTSGPTNSMRGAAYLSGLVEAAVVDIGGTTADIGIISRGFPRETTLDAQIGGVRTNFRLPDVLSLAIGGGSLVQVGDAVTVGPTSVGHRIREEALVFGGTTLTASDLAVAAGRADVGDPRLTAGIDAGTVEAGLSWIEREVADAVDRMRTTDEPLPVILVGGGSVLLDDQLDGAAKVHRPEHFEVANAVGAAMAEVGGTCERIYPLAQVSRDGAITEVTEDAVRAAIEAGADPETVRVVDVEEVGMSYLPGGQTRIRVRAVGSLVLKREHALDH